MFALFLSRDKNKRLFFLSVCRVNESVYRKGALIWFFLDQSFFLFPVKIYLRLSIKWQVRTTSVRGFWQQLCYWFSYEVLRVQPIGPVKTNTYGPRRSWQFRVAKCTILWYPFVRILVSKTETKCRGVFRAVGPWRSWKFYSFSLTLHFGYFRFVWYLLLQTFIMFILFVQVFGCAVLAAGIWMKFEVHKFLDVNPSNPVASHVAIFFMSVGVAIALVGLMSCYCTLSGNPILLYLVSNSDRLRLFVDTINH